MARRTWAQLEANLPDNTAGLIDAVHVREAVVDSQIPHIENRPPTLTDNQTDGFDVGHTWIDSSASPMPEAWRCVFSSLSTALWARIEGQKGEQGDPGPQGLPGADGEDGGIQPADGVLIVKHGATAGTARPTAAKVEWWGSVAPDNRVTGDFWFETGAFD